MKALIKIIRNLFFSQNTHKQPLAGIQNNELLQTAIRFHEQADLLNAEECYREVLKSDNDNTDALHLLAVLLSQKGEYESATRYLKQALSVRPAPEYYNNLGTIHYNQANYEAAIDAYESALKLNPEYTDAHFGRGNSQFQSKNFDAAKQSFQKTIELNPNHTGAIYNLANSFRELGELQSAVTFFEQVLHLEPEFTEAHNNLGFVLQEQGHIENAIACYRRAISINPGFTEAHSNMLNCLNNMTGTSEQEIYKEHCNWARQHTSQIKQLVTGDRLKNNDRLRIGYISPDFRKHSVAIFIEPLLEKHNREEFNIFAYYNYPSHDEVTGRLKSKVENWRDIAGLGDDDVCKFIVNDAIDILVDLSGHTGNNRLLVFARRPAPVQISYLGYPNTTGLSAIDYRFTDQYADPIGLTESFFTEKLLRLPDCFLCYQAPVNSPDVNELPALASGYITFGCFNNATKINNSVIGLWSDVLKSLPGSRILLKATQFGDQNSRSRILNMFELNGIPESHIEFAGLTASYYEHLDMYNKVDIALDCFPYNGTTTTCETLWMGVPVIGLTGDSHRSRVGTSILTNSGNSQLVAENPGEFVDKAVTLATDTAGLAKTRVSMRGRIIDSKLMDAEGFTAAVEQSYKNTVQLS